MEQDKTHEHGANEPYLAACSARLADTIMGFCHARVGKNFHAEELHRHVALATGKCAPASADRVLRDLRQKGRVWYTVLDRALSLYRIDAAFVPVSLYTGHVQECPS